MSRLSNFALQTTAVAILGYVLWWVLYGRPDIPFLVWIMICSVAGLLGLIPCMFVSRERRS